MSLLQRIKKGPNPSQQILESLLKKLYPDTNQLKQDIEAIINERSALSENQSASLASSPINFVIGFRPHTPLIPIRALLTKLHAEYDLPAQIEAVATEENIELNPQQVTFFKFNPIDFLMGVSAPRPMQVASHYAPNRDLRNNIMNQILNDEQTPTSSKEELRQWIRENIDAYLEEQELELPASESQQMFEVIVADLMGYGPLESLLSDDAVSEIRILGPKNIWIAYNGMLKKSEVHFDDTDQIHRIIDRMIAPLGKRHDEAMPLTKVRLPDGSHLSIIHNVIANNGPILTIFKRNHKPLEIRDLIQFGTLTEDMATFLRACVLAECHILVTGLSDTGKSVLLNTLGNFIGHDQFIVTIEESEELMLQQDSVACLHTRPPNIENKGAITQQQLLAHVQQMRPERILIGEAKGEEVFDLLTTVVPWMTTLRARDPEDALYQLEPLYLMADEKRPIQAVRSRIAERVDLIVHMERLQTGQRRLSSISEVDYVDDHYQVRPIFQFELLPPDKDGFRKGLFHAVNRPSERFLRRIGQFTNNDELIESIFGETP